MFLALFILFLIPFFAGSWVITLLYSSMKPEFVPPSPWRWIAGFTLPLMMAVYGLRKKSLNQSGAGAGLIVGFLLSISCISFLFSLLAFFVFASKATKFKTEKKRKFEFDFKEGGQRNWVQVVCNGGPAALLAVLYMLEVGSLDLPIDFRTTYAASWYAMAVMSSIACSSGDTFASEIGSVMGTKDPIHVITLKRVPRGTNGGISFIGTVSSMFGGLLVGLAYYSALLLAVSGLSLQNAPSQWPILLYGSLAGFLGSLIDSVLGATLQYSGKHQKLGCIVEHKAPDVEHISGIELLDNHSINLLASLITGLIMPGLAAKTWPIFS